MAFKLPRLENGTTIEASGLSLPLSWQKSPEDVAHTGRDRIIFGASTLPTSEPSVDVSVSGYRPSGEENARCLEVEATAFNNFDDPEREASLPNGSAKVKLQFPNISYPPRPDEEKAYKEALLVTAQSALAGLAVIMKLHQQQQ